MRNNRSNKRSNRRRIEVSIAATEEQVSPLQRYVITYEHITINLFQANCTSFSTFIQLSLSFLFIFALEMLTIP